MSEKGEASQTSHYRAKDSSDPAPISQNSIALYHTRQATFSTGC